MIQLPDIGLDVFQLFIETLGFETPTGSFFSLGIPEGGTNGEFVAELRHRAVDGDTTHDGNLIGFSDCLLRQKRTLKVLRCIITKLFEFVKRNVKLFIMRKFDARV